MKLKKNSKKAGLLLAVLMLFMSCGVFASEIETLVNLLAEKDVISYGQAQQILLEADEKAKKDVAEGKVKNVPKWVQNLSFSGDLRIRHQQDWDKSNNTRTRERLRFRLGANTKPVDNVEIGFGFATGALSNNADSNPNSTNHTFTAMNKAPLFVDYAYIKYTPTDWLTINGGKVKGKTQVWNASDLLWDGDYNPDGINANAKKKLSDKVSLEATAGYYIFGEGRKGNLPADAYIAQPVVSFKSGNISLKAALAYQQFNFADKTDMGTHLNKNLDYRVVNPSLEFKVKNVVYNLGLSLFGDYAGNIQDGDSYKVNGKDAKTGYLYGIKVGHDKTSKLGAWQLSAMYRYLEKYAIPEGLGDSDAYGGKAGKGYEIIATLGLTKNLSAGFDYYGMTDIDGNNPASLYQIDLVYKF